MRTLAADQPHSVEQNEVIGEKGPCDFPALWREPQSSFVEGTGFGVSAFGGSNGFEVHVAQGFVVIGGGGVGIAGAELIEGKSQISIIRNPDDECKQPTEVSMQSSSIVAKSTAFIPEGRPGTGGSRHSRAS